MLYNPTTAEFERQTELRIRVIAEEAWEKMNCDDIEALYITQLSKSEGGIRMNCTEKKLKYVEFSIPT